jgi:hypothetical protein
MGNCLPHGLGGRGHCVHMLGGDEGKVNERQGVGSFAYWASASLRMGMSGSASFQSVRKSL